MLVWKSRPPYWWQVWDNPDEDEAKRLRYALSEIAQYVQDPFPSPQYTCPFCLNQQVKYVCECCGGDMTAFVY